MADHFAVARRRREDVEASGAWWRCGRTTGALCATSRESAGEDGEVFPFVVIQEAGLDGFWIDRALQNEGIESHVVDPASIATSRRRRRAKTDGIDVEALVRALLAYKRGEPRVCAMVKAPTPEEEDRRSLRRERKVLIGERSSMSIASRGCLFRDVSAGYAAIEQTAALSITAVGRDARHDQSRNHIIFNHHSRLPFRTTGSSVARLAAAHGPFLADGKFFLSVGGFLQPDPQRWKTLDRPQLCS
jgi:hypothetical protein